MQNLYYLDSTAVTMDVSVHFILYKGSSVKFLYIGEALVHRASGYLGQQICRDILLCFDKLRVFEGIYPIPRLKGFHLSIKLYI